VRIVEAEAAFAKEYADSLGLPEDTEFAGEAEGEEEIDTVEKWFADLEDTAERALKEGRRCLYLVDSLDALSDKAEQEADFTDATYGTQKAKALSKLFRKLVKKLARCHVTLIIVSQIRDKIGVTFGKKTQRAGGRGMDFYASQVVWLAHISRLSKTRGGQKRDYGIRVKAKCEKNKIGRPFRECEFDIEWDYGVEDLKSNVRWLLEVKEVDGLFDSLADAKAFLKGVDALDEEAYWEETTKVADEVKRVWRDIETRFAPKRNKRARPGRMEQEAEA